MMPVDEKVTFQLDTIFHFVKDTNIVYYIYNAKKRLLITEY